ncbi:TatD DNase family Scn1 [Lactarius indigo]|nr:TatD DNase family Scn1 [Lactarius indigo]
MSPAPQVLAHLIDVHCHPTDAPSITASSIESLPCTLCAMSTQVGDQSKVAALARAHPDRVVPAFGYHPWWAHRISLSAPAGSVPDSAAHYRALFFPESSEPPTAKLEAAFARLLFALPPPIPLADILADVRVHLTEFPSAMLGEVGIDRVARIPFAGPGAPPDADNDIEGANGNGNGRRLSPFLTPLAHQFAVLEAQLALAVELRRNFDRMAAAHGAAWYAISVDVHSCKFSPEAWREIGKHHPNVYLSLSTAINDGIPNFVALVRECAPTRLLVESDWPDARDAPARTWDMACMVAEIHGWPIEDTWEDAPPSDEEKWGVIRRLESNWRAFVKGGHVAPIRGLRSRERRRRDYSLDLVESDTEDEGGT